MSELAEQPEYAPPDDTFVRHRWIPQARVDEAIDARDLMLEHGCVRGLKVYPSRHKARWQAERLIRLWVELRLLERWDVREHIDRRHGGWMWSIEYTPGGST